MAVIEGAGLEPSETNLHQLADIFEDFRNRATASEEYKIAAEAAAKRAEAAAQGVVTETAGKIKEIQAAGDAQVSRINSSGAEVEQATQEGITRLQSKLQELISNLQSVGGQEASAVRSAAQAILDDINLVKKNVEASAKQAQDSATSASSSSLTATEQAALAKDSAASAKSSESSALASAGAAKNSETASKTSEANAKASEDAAKESAVSAQNSANAAADSVSKVNAAAVLTTRQSLTPEQKSVARENIDVEERYTAQPVGSYLFFAGKTVPEGYLLCNGAAVSRTTYARLFAAIGTTYGAGDGSTTFNLPDVNERFLQGTNALSSVGTKREASLPAITGAAAVAGDMGFMAHGASPVGVFRGHAEHLIASGQITFAGAGLSLRIERSDICVQRLDRPTSCDVGAGSHPVLTGHHRWFGYSRDDSISATIKRCFSVIGLGSRYEGLALAAGSSGGCKELPLYRCSVLQDPASIAVALYSPLRSMSRQRGQTPSDSSCRSAPNTLKQSCCL